MAETSFLFASGTSSPLFFNEDIFDGPSSEVGDNSSDAANLLNITSTILGQGIPDVFYDNSTLNATGEGNCHRTFRQGKLLSMIVGIQNIIGPPILVFGIVTNILTLLTLQQKGMDLSPYVHLSWLAIADMSGLLLILIDLYNDPLDRRWMLFRIYVYYPLSNVAAMMGVWIMVLVTLERCIVIRSIRANIRCTTSRAKAQVLAVFLISFALNVPRFFWFRVALSKKAAAAHCPVTYHICSYLQKWSGSKILTWMYSALNHFLPLCLLTTLNGFLIYSVHARRRRHPALGIAEGTDTVWSSEQTRFTVTLIAIVGLFIVLVMPSAFSDINILLPLLGVNELTEEVHVFQYVSNFLMWLNMSINFLMYTAINTRFKAAFKCMVWGWRRRALYWLCCWACRDPDKKYYLRHHYHHHHHHRHHNFHHRQNHMNGVKPNPSYASNGSSDRGSREKPMATRLNFKIVDNNSNSRSFLGRSRADSEKEATCGKGIRAVRAIFTKRSFNRNKASEVNFALQPSIRSSSTGTSGSSSQTPTESTEFCPMLNLTTERPAMIQESDSLSFLPDSSPETPVTPLATFPINDKEYPLTSEIQVHQESHAPSLAGEAKTDGDKYQNTAIDSTMVEVDVLTLYVPGGKMEDANHNKAVAELDKVDISSYELTNSIMHVEPVNSMTELDTLSIS